MNRRLSIPLILPAVAWTLLAGCSEPPQFDRIGAAAALAKTVADEQDHVTVAELSDWIIKDRRDFTLLDIRDKTDFDAGHIEGARHVPLAGLMSEASVDALPVGRKVVVYSNGTAHAAQATLLLRLIERDAYALLGGYNHWQAYLNDPQAAGAAEMDPARRARYQAVARDYPGDTPCGMPFSTLAGSVGGGAQTPGFVGVSKFYIGSKKFISAEGGIKRLAWLPSSLKEALKDMIVRRGEEVGVPDLYDKIATEKEASTEEEVIEFMQKVGHPALEMEPMM